MHPHIDAPPKVAQYVRTLEAKEKVMTLVRGLPLRAVKSRHAVTEQRSATGLRVSRQTAALLECGHVRLVDSSKAPAATMQCMCCGEVQPKQAERDDDLKRQLELQRELNAELERKLALQKQINDAELERLTRPAPSPEVKP
jgi:hypothetical protein